jgi:hypothetical protein
MVGNITNINLYNKLKNKKRINQITDNVMHKAPMFPKTVEYKDIDNAFYNWCNDELEIIYENKKLPTIILLSNQRFSEYSQTWQEVDVDKNLLMNFKAMFRENNPNSGSILGGGKNIPGNIKYTLFRNSIIDDNGSAGYDIYSMKQPFSVDIKYQLSLFTNKYELLNNFNQKIQDQFKSIECYIAPNGHYMPMFLEEILDESEYNLENRKFFSQTFVIKCAAYIIDEKSFEVDRVPANFDVLIKINDGRIKPIPTFEEYTNSNNIKIEIIFSEKSDDYISFTIPTNIQISNIITNNIDYIQIHNGSKKGEILNNTYPFVIYNNNKMWINIKRHIIGNSLVELFGQKI